MRLVGIQIFIETIHIQILSTNVLDDESESYIDKNILKKSELFMDNAQLKYNQFSLFHLKRIINEKIQFLENKGGKRTGTRSLWNQHGADSSSQQRTRNVSSWKHFAILAFGLDS